jgi:hypothetical protein
VRAGGGLVEAKDNLRKKFDLKVEFQRRNKKYASYCEDLRNSKKPYMRFYDPFTMSNDELWDHAHRFKKETVMRAQIPLLIDYVKMILEWRLKREPTAEELIKDLKNQFDNSRYIDFDPHASVNALVNGFKKIVQEEKSKTGKKDEWYSDRDFLSGYRESELKRYLAVYDARETIVNGKKMKWISVCEKLFPKEKFCDDLRLNLLRDYRKACEIIEHV